MEINSDAVPTRIDAAIQAIGNLVRETLHDILVQGQEAALVAHSEIEVRPADQRSTAFYRHFLPVRGAIVTTFADNYRRYIRLAFAHRHEIGIDPAQWAWIQLHPVLTVMFEWIGDWFILACDGENQHVRKGGSAPFVPGQIVSFKVSLTPQPLISPESWRAPAWLFQISVSHFGIGFVKESHVPARDSEERLGTAHTRLLLKGARRVFLWLLGATLETVRNEETAAAGAIPEPVLIKEKRGPNKREGWEQKVKLCDAIRKILIANPHVEGIDFCTELDQRHAPPLADWEKGANGKTVLLGRKLGPMRAYARKFGECAKKP